MPQFTGLFWFVILPLLSAQQEPLHRAIDRLILANQPKAAVPPAPRSGDAEFLRRVYLDLAGTIPTASEARAFLDDPSPGKRAELIERLLHSKSFAEHWGGVLDELFMDRRPEKHIPQAEWRKYLVDSVAANKPYDVLVTEILSADGTHPTLRAPAKFFLDREGDLHLWTRDIGRVFLGMNLTCCQCHDHPLVHSYRMEHYYGLFAFLNRTEFSTEWKPVALGEKAEGDATYVSVFDPSKTVKTALPHVPGAEPMIEPTLEKGQEYRVAPAKGVRPVPVWSRRSWLASSITQSRQFARTLANRLWARMLGRGLVHPVEFDHPGNPPSHPFVLDRLTEEVVARKFDLRSILGEIARSETYQRSSAWEGEREPERFIVAAIRPLDSETLARSLLAATGCPEPERQMDNVRRYFLPTFSAAPGESDSAFRASLDQVLSLSNGFLLRDWLTPRPGSLTDRLNKLESVSAIADELFLSVLTRRPTTEEIQAVEDYLKGRNDREIALQELAWALLTSSEFRFNH